MSQIEITKLEGEQRDSLCDIPYCPNLIDFKIWVGDRVYYLCWEHAQKEGFEV